ncbi:hypothetical protein M9Y10_000839 [Tritrichomonas musculus]|uniref:Cache domain-containing protein n=1 Tax=Tritrichomonas musculus TaxID=1915356 RepID=A0ABR2L705_9EUKA
MKRSEIVSMPFNHSDNTSYSYSENPKKRAKKSQYSPYQEFVKKRNAVRVDRYFIMLRTTRIKAVISVIALILIITIIAVYIILSRQAFISFSNDLTDTALFSSSEQILSSISFLIDEPHFFASFLANFIHDADLSRPSKSTAYTYATYLTNANLASSKNIFWWKIGLPDGTLIGVFGNHSYENPVWYFADANDRNTLSLYAYPTNKTTLKNESYPNEPGIYVRDYNATHRHWYQAALENKQTTWTNLYYSLTESLPVFSSVAGSFNDTDGSVEYVISLDLTLEHVQEYLRKMLPGRDSRLAITTSDGFVVAVAGFSPNIDDQIDFNGIITKSIKQLDDPVWKCVTKDSQFNTLNNFSVICPINDQSNSGTSPHDTYRVIRSKVNLADNYDWTIHIALKVDYIVQSGQTIYNNKFIISSMICLLIWIILYFIQYWIKKNFHVKETRFLLEKSKKKTIQHVSQIGIPQGIEILQRIISSKETDENTSIEIDLTLNQIREDPENFTFNKKKFAQSFTNPQVRDKILNIFGIVIDDDNLNDITIEADAEPRLDYSLSTNNSLNDNYFRDKNNQELSENELDENSHFTFLEPLHQNSIKFLKFRMSFNIDYPSTINYVKNLGIEVFQNAGLLTLIGNDDELVLFLLNEISKISPSLFRFCSDSFGFLELLLSNYTLQNIYDNSDFVIAIYITLLSFHIVMNDRICENNPPIKRFFLLDSLKLSQTAHGFLDKILEFCKNNDNQSNLNEIDENTYSNIYEKLNNISKYVDILTATTPISKHIEVLNRCLVFIPSYIQNFQPKKVESLLTDAIRFIYNTSTISFMIGSADFVNSNINFMFTGYSNESEISGFVDCLTNVYISKVHSTIKHIYGTLFYDNLFDK